jgi:hypothetical protein
MAQRRFAVLDRMAWYVGPPLARPGSDSQVCHDCWGQRTQLSEVDIMITDIGPGRSRPEGAAAGHPDVPGGRRLSDRAPLRYAAALRALAGCAVSTGRLLRRRRIRLPTELVGTRLRFADGTLARVYRETVVERGATEDPCVLVVEFQLRLVRGRAHAAFRLESLLNTPLFAGFPGFASKLWLAHDERGRYRGVYEWDGPRRADHYARALWRVLALVSVPGSIHYMILPGLHRDEFLARPLAPAWAAADRVAWWRPVEVLDRQPAA